MADGLLSIGAFSRTSSISVRTLRNYHESGLLVPASIDAGTGYRSYTVDQLADALIIVRLRDLDLPLPAVHRVLTARDPELTRAVLAEHERTMRARLADAERIVATLQHGLPSAATPAHVVATPALHALERRATVPGAHLWSWLEESAAMLLDAAGDRRSPGSSVGALYTGSLVDDEAEDVVAFLPVAGTFLLRNTPAPLAFGERPAGAWAALAHTDGFATVGDTYRLLGAWVARNADAQPDGPIWEQYPLLGTGVTPNDAAIEIRWPIRR